MQNTNAKIMKLSVFFKLLNCLINFPPPSKKSNVTARISGKTHQVHFRNQFYHLMSLTSVTMHSHSGQKMVFLNNEFGDSFMSIYSPIKLYIISICMTPILVFTMCALFSLG